KEARSLLASPGGRWLVSTGPDTTRIWDVAAGQELQNVIPQDRGTAYYGITFVDADRLMLGNNSGLQRVLELPSRKEILRCRSTGGYAGAAYSPAAGLAAFIWHDGPMVSIADVTFRAPTAVEQVQIDKFLKDFDDDSYDIREAATAGLRQIGSVA